MELRDRLAIERENDPRVLRALLESLVNDNARQRDIIKVLTKQKAELNQSSLNIEEHVKLLRRMMFGKSSEKRGEASDRPRDKSAVDAQLFSQAAFPSPQVRDEKNGKAKGSDLEAVTVDHVISDSELVTEATERGISNAQASMWIATGLYDQIIKIQVIERMYVQQVHRKYKYKLKPEYAAQLEKDVIITARGDDSLLPGMNYSTDFVASVVADKYISHMPLERQLREIESLGLKGMQNSTLARMAALAGASLEPLAETILKEDLLKSDVAIHADETPWKIQNRKERDGHMWVISNRYGSYYFYRPSRSGDVFRKVIGDYRGPVVTDGYSAYNFLHKLGLSHAICWAHARRNFEKIEKLDPSVKPVLDLMDELFKVEREATSFIHLLELRTTKSALIIPKIRQFLYDELPRSRSESEKRKAIKYAIKYWSGLTIFLNDVRVPLSNNEAERTIRHAVVGRKSYYGSGNQLGAATAATLFTIIESAKKNDVDPRTFLNLCLHKVAKGESLETPLAYARRTRSGQDA